jgi:hypothetical protein
MNGNFNAVAAVPGGTAWAVGSASFPSGVSSATIVARWTGKAWAKVASPTLASGGQLSAVAATSTKSAWAVGFTGVGTQKTLILHWNGKSWS